MAEQKRPNEIDERTWMRQDEENLLLEVSEDRRLVRLGIDPDGTPLEIWLRLKERAAQIERERASHRKLPR